MSSFEKDAQFLKSNAAAMRALAGGKEHQVTYAGTDTHVGKDDVRLPALPPTATAAQKASLRGAADGAALWLARHNPMTHKKHCPAPDGAKAIFESAERARVEAIGARHMKGVGNNLNAALNQRYENRQIDAPGSADDACISEVVRLLLREELTGSPPPKNLSMVMDLWRPWVKSRGPGPAPRQYTLTSGAGRRLRWISDLGARLQGTHPKPNPGPKPNPTLALTRHGDDALGAAALARLDGGDERPDVRAPGGLEGLGQLEHVRA